MTVAVRVATAEDLAGVADVQAAALPFLMVSAESLAHDLANLRGEPPLEFVAELDGRVVGWASIGPNRWSARERAVGMRLVVHPDFRRRGIGSVLWQRVRERHDELGGLVLAGTASGEEGLAFAESRGFDVHRVSRVSRRRLQILPAPPPIPSGARIVALSDVDDLRPVHATAMLAQRDVPGTAALVGYPFEEWRSDVLTDPRLDLGLSTVAFEDATAVALVLVQRVGDRVHTSFTGTHPAHRGRGLAFHVKANALYAAARAGAVDAYTVNDAENAPMLAVNKRLGYEPFAVRHAVQLETPGVEG